MADNLKVNKQDWAGLSQEDQTRISNILSATGLLKAGSSITPDAGSPSFAALTADSTEAFGINFCKIGCDLAEAAAAAACSAIPPPGNAICIAAAHAGGEFCRSKC